VPNATAKATHTPGPWRHGDGDRAVTGRAGARVIASVGDLCIDSQWPEDQANARLIAAAPTMYEALREMVKAVDPEGARRFAETDSGLGFALHLARAAIAKAEGRADA
jgi:hypothetical protein